MVEPSDDKVASSGFGVVGFLLSLNSLGARVRNGEMTLTEVADIISRSRHFLDSFPGDAKVASFAENALKLAEQMLSAASAQRPPGGPN
jgi:hypothetical protein